MPGMEKRRYKFIADTLAEAKRRNWPFDLRPGNWSLLERLFAGPWDEDFVVLRPGQKLIARNDECVLDASPADAKDP